MKKGLIIIGLLSLFVLSACGVSKPVGSEELKVVKIGIIAPFSGDASAYGQDMEKILQYQLGIINEQAFKKGKKFELVFEDGKCTGTNSVTAIQKLVDFDGVNVILGGACSSETLAITPITNDKGVILLSALSSNPDIEKQGDYVFSLSYRDDLVGIGLAEELKKYSKIAIVTEQNDYNVGLRKVVLDNLKNSTSIVADETFEKGASDFRNILEKVANSKPEAIFLNPNAGVTAENLIKQLAEIKSLNNIQLISQGMYLPDNIRDSSQGISEGMIIIDAPSVTSKELTDTIANIESSKGKIPTLGNYYTASCLDALNVLAEVITSVGLDSVKIKDSLRSDTFNGYLGKIYFGKDNFVQNIQVGKYIVKDGKAVYQN